MDFIFICKYYIVDASVVVEIGLEAIHFYKKNTFHSNHNSNLVAHYYLNLDSETTMVVNCIETFYVCCYYKFPMSNESILK